MGVNGLWTVVHPCARPIKIETLNKKRLAVDASIWIYQFLKAVRDKEGNALRNSHVVGFFRRICKLLFFGIKPVFVFDGGAPALKRQTIAGRKRRREGRREDAVRTAGKLLAVQMQRRAEEDEVKRKQERNRPPVEEEEPLPENLVYVDELQMTEQERRESRKFRKKDAYHLPELDVALENMGAPDDPRIMSHEELEEYARQFHTGEDINLYDFSKIDFNSPFFLSLPASDRYNILNAARLRSRLRMGYSKDQLDTMFPDRMAFSRFQIERVTERNELTQRLMNINGMNGEDAMFGVNGGGRIAGEKGKEYVLVKNDGVEGGWALGVVSKKDDGERNQPIDIDELAQKVKADESDEGQRSSEEEAEGFEDVPIEGLNRLPKRRGAAPHMDVDAKGRAIAERRRALYTSRQKQANEKNRRNQESDSLFVDADGADGVHRDTIMDDLFEGQPGSASEDEDDALNRAIAMSMEKPVDGEDDTGEIPAFDEQSQSRRDDESRPFFKGTGRMIAHIANNRSNAAAVRHRGNESDDDMDLQGALAESRSGKHQAQSGPRVFGQRSPERVSSGPTVQSTKAPATSDNPFGGPLPFEKLDFSKSLLGAKKRKADVEGGGFERDGDEQSQMKPNEKPKPLPPWFSGDVREEVRAQREIEDHQDDEDGDEGANLVKTGKKEALLHRQETGEVIDLEKPDDEGGESDVEMLEARPVGLQPIDPEIRMGDVADLVRAEPPVARTGVINGELDQNRGNSIDRKSSEEPLEWEDSDREESSLQKAMEEQPERALTLSPSPELEHVEVSNDQESLKAKRSTGSQKEPSPSSPKSPSPEFEDVEPLPVAEEAKEAQIAPFPPDEPTIPSLPVDDSFDQAPIADDAILNDDDDSDDELMAQLATEAEEHARFASELNHKPQGFNKEEYERELRGLRNQQKKDRRDADEVSHIMVTECQTLLRLFGLPYVTAPMEAEAQCAELVRLGLVDGIVTDDSDVFLFGGTRVYKNMFNQAKFVECYLSNDFEREFDLQREKLIRFAHLLGSDYTEGIPGVGPVTALEILAEFNGPDGLEAFRDWWQDVQLRPPPSKKDAKDPSISAFRRKFARTNAAKIFLPPAFPSLAVTAAYLQPDVDSTPTPFQWGVPDLDRLRDFLMATIGWTQDRTDEVLVPVIRDLNRREREGTQSNLTRFFEGGVGVGAMKGKGRGRGGGARGGAAGGEDEGMGRGSGRGKKSARLEGALGRLREGATSKRKRTNRAPRRGAEAPDDEIADGDDSDSEAGSIDDDENPPDDRLNDEDDDDVPPAAQGAKRSTHTTESTSTSNSRRQEKRKRT
ncbi:MAG: DNA repair protein rad2 [Caeruleum heppii]|nr:MAG: DNA repair protein rad2 [Caeruleum heppii]